ncbi:MAG: DEAD/DEAH box helicase family protein [Alphaproteobacteria bacterium]|nr:DEAD/DEAH box helicase family protein [Alphaproteobacteria bacterium]
MELQLENLKYQNTAIQAVIKVFEGTEKNTFDNACIEGIRSNFCKLTAKQLVYNIKAIAKENGIDEEKAKYSADNDLCIEMETGTGKTLVYIKTIYELYKHYAFTKFIILVPSIAIRQGTLGTFKTFEKQLESIYGFKVSAFDYDSKKLNKVTKFIEEQHPQVMIMTTGAFSSDDRILNRTQREDLFNNLPYIDAIAKVRPIIFMDEPQEGMDSDNMIERLKTLSAEERKERYSNKADDREKAIFKTLDPLFKIRYSATHKTVKNLLYRLTPYDSYKQGLVKKIEVLTVTEKNDEANIKIQFSEVKNENNKIRGKLKAWKLKAGKFVFEETNWLKDGDNLGEKTNNPSYLNYKIEQISKNLITQQWFISFQNGIELQLNNAAGNIEIVWALQLEWLIHRHFTKSQKLQSKGIKVLSLIFIDKVSNYMGEDPKIKNLFVEKYKTIYPQYNHGNIPTSQHIHQIQGYYFAQNAKGEFSDNEGGLKEQKKIYELILQKKDELLTIGNPIEFVFSHSALGVGWDNPNVFNIATLNTAYSEIRKRQEIGRGLRICVNQQGQRVYENPKTQVGDELNLLTIIPNETYETFVTQYQKEINDVYGTTIAGAKLIHNHKGKDIDITDIKRNKTEKIDSAFRKFWKLLAKKTDYTVNFIQSELTLKCIAEISKIKINDYLIESSSRRITSITEENINSEFGGVSKKLLKASFQPFDYVEEFSEGTSLDYNSSCTILYKLSNHEQFIKNPHFFIQEAIKIANNVEMRELQRGLVYHVVGEMEGQFDDLFPDIIKHRKEKNLLGGIEDTPNRGVYEGFVFDSEVERWFGKRADIDPEVVCFIKLPSWYKIPIPIGKRHTAFYEPDFGLVMKHKILKDGNESEFYFVIETKGTNDINDRATLTESEIYKIECALKHFKAIGVDVHYKAPLKDYQVFKTQAEQTILENTQK